MASDLEELRGSLSGDVLDPGDREYDRARLCFNLLIDRHPAAIARCVDAHDVVAALAFGQEHGLEIAVRGEPLDRVRAAFGPASFDRLRALKSRYDPANVLRRNQNIRPAG